MTKTYAQLTREIQALQASAEKLRATEVKAAIAKLNESIAHYGLTADDLHFPGSTSTSARRQGSASTRSNGSTAAKYSDGQGNTWGGRGPRPAWLRNAISSGRSLDSFETAGTSASSGSSQPGQSAGRSSQATATAAKAKLPALYGHPKTGQTWSGRGPKPAWLKQGLKKRGTSIDDFLISAQTSTPAEAPKATPAQNASAKPAAAQRPAAPKKSLAEKIGSRSKAPAVSAPDTAVKAAPVTSGAPAKKTRTAPAATASSPTPSAPAKKTAPKSSAKRVAKPTTKTSSAPRKNLPSSMAPPVGSTPTPSTVPTAAPMPAPQTESVEGRGEAVST